VPGSLLVASLRRLMSRNPFADRLTFVYDLPQLVGIGLAAHAVAADLPGFGEWLSGVLQDHWLQPSDRFQALLRAHVRALLSGQTVAEGRTNGAVPGWLCISSHNVKIYLRYVFAKLGVSNRVARRRGTSLDRVMSSPLAASTIDRVPITHFNRVRYVTDRVSFCGVAPACAGGGRRASCHQRAAGRQGRVIRIRRG
jgi:hypothetical protein